MLRHQEKKTIILNEVTVNSTFVMEDTTFGLTHIMEVIPIDIISGAEEKTGVDNAKIFDFNTVLIKSAFFGSFNILFQTNYFPDHITILAMLYYFTLDLNRNLLDCIAYSRNVSG
jgi:hypothetical protein